MNCVYTFERDWAAVIPAEQNTNVQLETCRQSYTLTRAMLSIFHEPEFFFLFSVEDVQLHNMAQCQYQAISSLIMQKTVYTTDTIQRKYLLYILGAKMQRDE